MEATVAAQLENVDDRKVDFDLFSAGASNELLGLFSERQQSISIHSGKEPLGIAK